MIKLTGINKYVRKTEAQKARIKIGAANYVRQATQAVLKDLVLNVPQWTGDLAASWRIDLNYMPADQSPSSMADIDNDYEPGDNFEPSFIGDERAWREALSINTGHLKAIKYNSIIRIVNVKPFADELAASNDGEEMGLRPGNYIPGDLLAVAMVSAKYKVFNNQLGLQLKSVMNYA